MKVKTGRLVDGKKISSTTVDVWDATRWLLPNTSLLDSLRQRAYTAAGLTYPDPNYTNEAFIKYNQENKNYVFEIHVIRRQWEEVTE